MITYTVIYPAVNHDNPTNDPYITSVGKQRSFKHSIDCLHSEVLETLFAGMNGGSGAEFPWFLGAQARSMSVGDVVKLELDVKIDDEWFICDSFGWLPVTPVQAQSWLDFPRKYGCCSFELSKWKLATLKAHFAGNITF